MCVRADSHPSLAPFPCSLPLLPAAQIFPQWFRCLLMTLDCPREGHTGQNSTTVWQNQTPHPLSYCSYPVFPTTLDPGLFNPQHLKKMRASHSNLLHPPSPAAASTSPAIARRTPAEKAKDKEVRVFCVLSLSLSLLSSLSFSLLSYPLSLSLSSLLSCPLSFSLSLFLSLSPFSHLPLSSLSHSAWRRP